MRLPSPEAIDQKGSLNKAGGTLEDFDSLRKRGRTLVEKRLRHIFASYPETDTCRVAEYIVMAGGHRWRALVLLAAGSIFDKNAESHCVDAACAMELAHAATLLLDDLPSMDNAHLRRGRPCAHLVYPRWAVEMAPSYLVSNTYELLLDIPNVSPERRVRASLAWGRAARALNQGQEMDLAKVATGGAEDHLVDSYRQKSGALFAAAAEIGAILTGARAEQARLLATCGLKLGLYYQFLDDLAEIEATADETGKQAGPEVNRRTAIDVLGIEESKRAAARLRTKALDAIAAFGPEAESLRSIVRAAGVL